MPICVRFDYNLMSHDSFLMPGKSLAMSTSCWIINKPAKQSVSSQYQVRTSSFLVTGMLLTPCPLTVLVPSTRFLSSSASYSLSTYYRNWIIVTPLNNLSVPVVLWSYYLPMSIYCWIKLARPAQ
jgi:hypothetical protein